MSDWRPIETAPKDGKPVLLGHRDFEPMSGFWLRSGRWNSWPWYAQPTHWMPMPERPA